MWHGVENDLFDALTNFLGNGSLYWLIKLRMGEEWRFTLKDGFPRGLQ